MAKNKFRLASSKLKVKALPNFKQSYLLTAYPVMCPASYKGWLAGWQHRDQNFEGAIETCHGMNKWGMEERVDGLRRALLKRCWRPLRGHDGDAIVPILVSVAVRGR